MAENNLASTKGTEEYEDDFEDAVVHVNVIAAQPPKAPGGEVKAGDRGRSPSRQSHSVIAAEIAAELAPARRAVMDSSDAAAPVLLPGEALMKAAINGRSREVETLLRNGASVRFTDKHGWTPLHWACSHGYTDVITAILRYDPSNSTNSDGEEISPTLTSIQENLAGWTPLHVACIQEQPAAVKLLLGAGANPTIVDKQGDKPIDCVKSSETDAAREIIQLLNNGDTVESPTGK